MSYVGKGKAFLTWAQKWTGYEKLNAIVADSGDLAVVVAPDQSTTEKYIDGTAKHTITFALTAMLDYSDGNDEVNADANELMETWCDWLLEREALRDYPDFTGALVTEVEPIDQYPYMAMTYQGSKLAKYQFQARITYED